MKIAFCGTPEFALPSLQMLIDDGHELVVFTQPDRPKNRGHKLTPPPVKTLAQQNGIPVYQFERIKSKEAQEALTSFAPELLITCAFGQLLSRKNLSVASLGNINVHGSLLPKWRGASPVQSAIISGDKTSGVTIMNMVYELDAGDILSQRAVEIGENETAFELLDRLSYIGAELLRETLPKIVAGNISSVPQNQNEATFCTVIEKEQARIDFSKSSCTIHNLVRGMNPTPGAWTTLNGKIVRIWRTSLASLLPDSAAALGTCVVASSKQGLFVKTGDGTIEINELQLEGGKRMDACSLLNGKKLQGSVFE